MNNSINVASATQSKASEIAASKVNSGRQGGSAAKMEESTGNADSFQDSIEQVSQNTESRADSEIAKKPADTTADAIADKTDGNNLPPEENNAGTAEPDEPAIQQTASETNPGEQGELANITSQLRQLLSNAEKAGNGMTSSTKISETQNAAATGLASALTGNTTNTKATNVNTDGKNALKSSTEGLSGITETSEISTESVTSLSGEKSQLLSKAISQQQILQNLQASSLTPASSTPVSATGNPAIDSLPLLNNTTVNNFTTTNLQSLPQAEITEAFNRPGWSQAMGKQALMMINQNIGVAEIKLNPAHLGPIEMLIDMSDEQVSVSMSSRHAVVREAMEQALPKLREMLEQEGFTLANTDISKQSFAEQREQNAENKQNNNILADADLSLSSGVNEQLLTQNSNQSGMVDYYI